MLFDGFTTLAQIINFLILVLLLKRFLFGPVLRAIDRREQGIQDIQDQADLLQQQALEQRQLYESKVREFDAERRKRLDQTAQEIEQERVRLTREAQESVHELRIQHLRALRRDAGEFKQAISRQSGAAALAIAGKILADLADEQLDARIVRMLLDRLSQQDPDELAAWRTSLNEVGRTVEIQSAWPLAEAAREQIALGLQEKLAPDLQLSFAEDPNLQVGIEIRSADYRLSWTVREYLGELEQTLDHLILNELQSTGGEAPHPAQTGESSHAFKRTEGPS
jgi:F-type H+-transporting ATPase subunit b